MKKLVILSGAGMSAESGLPTFRDMGGIWEKYDVTQVASPEAWQSNPELVLRFYNERRKKLFESKPNIGHEIIAGLDNSFNVQIVTQNVDDLHEQAGSKNVLHLHGELKKARSTSNPELVYELNHWELKTGDLCDEGSQLRPHIVWFGEPVDAIYDAMKIVETAEIFVVVGTSLNVYPAAGLLSYVPSGVPIFVIDTGQPNISASNVTVIKEKASDGLKKLREIL
ncbi:SIR2 family NAD-dependent protein deacylase [Natronoflexus pectinivorans]|uniref:protein acetyllysine N-acetyltransferase n=1 Tax=Natronoflexus pectinivorans TaxID=682526 RepID=A0A4V2RWZ0_9BACT|nr:Sir2 family NAD-dependent protein deacetylase [Natronoflexus pectinivorans]TCO10741.1 NAD-dependent deacetylase [Natronoflexus pectinivorans]